MERQTKDGSQPQEHTFAVAPTADGNSLGMWDFESPATIAEPLIVTPEFLSEINDEGFIAVSLDDGKTADVKTSNSNDGPERHSNRVLTWGKMKLLPVAAAITAVAMACNPSEGREPTSTLPTLAPASPTNTIEQPTNTTIPLDDTSTPFPTSSPEPSATPTDEPDTPTPVPVESEPIEPIPTSAEVQSIINILPYPIKWVGQYDKSFAFAISEGSMINAMEFNPEFENSVEKTKDVIMYGLYRAWKSEQPGVDTYEFLYKTTMENNKEEFEDFKRRVANGENMRFTVTGYKDSMYPDANDRTQLTKITIDPSKPVLVTWTPDDRVSTYVQEGFSFGYRVVNGNLVLEIWDAGQGKLDEDGGSYWSSLLLTTGMTYLSEREQQGGLGEIPRAVWSRAADVRNELFITLREGDDPRALEYAIEAK